MTDYLAKVHGHYASGQKWSFGWHISSSQSLSTLAGNWATWATDFWNNAGHGVETLFPTTTILDQTDVTELTATLKFLQRSAPTTLSLPGTDANAGGADEVSAVMSLRALTLSKGDKGRSKLPSPAEDFVVNGELTVAGATRIGAAGTALLAFVNADGSDVFVFNRIVTISKPVALTKTLITEVFGSTKLGTVRKRTKHVLATYH